MVDDTEPNPFQIKIPKIKAPQFESSESNKASEKSPLIPSDLKISPEVASQVGDIVESWAGGDIE